MSMRSGRVYLLQRHNRLWTPQHGQQTCWRAVQIVSDHGSDVLAGIRLFRQQTGTSSRPMRSPIWPPADFPAEKRARARILVLDEFSVKACESTRQQSEQAVGSFLNPRPVQ